MNASPLTNLLFASGLPTEGYDFRVVSSLEIQQMGDEIVAISDASTSDGPSLTFVELEAEKTIWLITREGHFAHPSMLKRSLLKHETTRVVQVSGVTAGSAEVMRVWMGQFREQDAQISRGFS
ncbi:MAG: hypothetical protein V4476_18515 [Pseudomonadota bacterium]